MAKYAYPAIFTPEENGMFSVEFPDIEGCFTCGDDLSHAIEMAQDALALMLYHFEEAKITAPTASDLKRIALEGNQFVNYIACDTMFYRKKNNTRAVKKTLSIPEWLNEAAMAQGINFSQVLQDGLKAELGL